SLPPRSRGSTRRCRGGGVSANSRNRSAGPSISARERHVSYKPIILSSTDYAPAHARHPHRGVGRTRGWRPGRPHGSREVTRAGRRPTGAAVAIEERITPG